MREKVCSIITVNFNNGNGLLKTIKSVLDQTFVDFEFIVIDGGSTDNSQDHILENQQNIDFWVSQPDGGIYEAMNKGIAKAKGEYCLFLNSGDYFLDRNTLQSVFDSRPTEDILYGNLKSDHRDYVYPETITLNTFVKSTIPHQASFIKTDLFEKFGNYETKYRIIADWVFYVKAVLVHKVSYKHLNMYISFFEHGGISTNKEHLQQMKRERAELLWSLFPQIYPDYEDMHTEMHNLKKELNNYKNSRIISTVKKMQNAIAGKKTTIKK